MIGLYILLGLGAVFLFFMLITRLNEWGENETGHTFFTTGSVFSVSLGYWMLYWGDSWRTNVQSKIDDARHTCLYSGSHSHGCVQKLEQAGDPLNGTLLMAVGFVILIAVFWYHMKEADRDRSVALTITILFFILSIPMSIGLFFLVLAVIAWLSETKPVYTINHSDSD